MRFSTRLLSIGSVLSSTYSTKIAEFFAGTPAPPQVVDAAKGSLGGAIGVAERLRETGQGALADKLLAVADQSFVDALHTGALVAAVATFVGVLVALAFLPARAQARDRALQHDEYAAEHQGDLGIPDTELTPAPVVD